MKHLIMILTTVTFFVQVQAQELDSYIKEDFGQKVIDAFENVFESQKPGFNDKFNGLTKKIEYSRMISPYGLEVTYNKTTHILFPASIRYVDLGSDKIIAGVAGDAENVLRVKAAVENFPETNIWCVHGKLPILILTKHEKGIRNNTCDVCMFPGCGATLFAGDEGPPNRWRHDWA
jgi:hypothetical protein